MTTYRLTPIQMSQLAFALGASAAAESDPQGVRDSIRLANKVSESCAQGGGSLICNHQESGTLGRALQSAATMVEANGPEYARSLTELGGAIRAGEQEQTSGASPPQTAGVATGG